MIAKDIERVDYISKEDFINNHVKKSKPVIIKNLIENWPALNKWNFDFFKQEYADVPVTTIELENNAYKVSPKFGAVLSEMTLKNAITKAELSEVAIASGDDFFHTDLKKDYTTLELCVNEKFLRVRFLMSPNNTITKIHQDLFENLYCMVKGSKKITLFEPNENVYPYSRFSKLPNHAQIDPDNLDLIKFPKMKNATKYEVVLEKGETLYIPSMWWHHLISKGETISISHWWAHGFKVPIIWAALKYKNLRGL